MTVFSKVYTKCSECVHPWTTSCSFFSLEVFYHVFRTSFKIYGTLYLIATLLGQKGWEYVRKELLYEVLRSTVFLSLNGSLFAAFFCLIRNLFGVFTVFTSGFLPASLASYIAIIVERPERRGLLALYMFNNAVEVIFNALVNRNIITTLSYGEVYMFCVATGLIMYLYRANKLNNGFIKRIVRLLLGEQQSNVNSISPESVGSTFGCKDIYKRVLSTVKAFSIGYLLQAAPGILNALFNPRKIPQILMNKNNFKLALFLSSFVSIFQFVEFMLMFLREKKDPYNSFIAGAASGLSMLFYRSSTISLYLLTKVIEIIFKNAQYEGVIPFIPYVDIIIYTISTATTFHMAVFERETLKPSYMRFLTHITNNRNDSS
ncbi:transmembrane protein 135-like isoform X2 [Dendronephthya gigantea]|uniref:transmembrane protein 135-like isoform X2 n=1 Tax=Dendronephthya gigantea TaxID=151771 RepID=UPI001069BA6C|nr:transmembrane protein 135-like isoform X2 [Dendronephthya gigantea]